MSTAQLLIDYCAEELSAHLQTDRLIDLDGMDTWLVGREPTCSLPINHTKVSREHAQIVCDARRHYIQDLDSTNGTRVNGDKLLPFDRRPLRSGDEIQIANVLVLLFEDPTVTAIATQAYPHLSQRFSIDTKKRVVHIRRERLDKLPEPQFKLLELLFDRSGEIVLRDEIAEALWPDEYGAVSEDMITNTVARLRQRLREVDANHNYIETVRGKGFRFLLPN